MSPEIVCRCAICRMRKSLSARLTRADSLSWYQNLAADTPALVGISTIPDLVSFMHEKHKDEAGHIRADAVYLALLRAPSAPDHREILNTLFTLLFLKSLHTMLRAVSSSYPQIDPEDVAQELMSRFLRVLRSRFLRRRTAYIGKVIAERTRRNIFRWAIPTSQSMYRHAVHLGVHEPAALSEHENNPSLLLDHFLSACLREGRITSEETQLLRLYELVGFSGEELGRRIGASPKALSARVRRLLARLRVAAEKLRAEGAWPGSFLPG